MWGERLRGLGYVFFLFNSLKTSLTPTFRSGIILAAFQSFGVNAVTCTEDKSAPRINRGGLWEGAQLIPIPRQAGSGEHPSQTAFIPAAVLSQQRACRWDVTSPRGLTAPAAPGPALPGTQRESSRADPESWAAPPPSVTASSLINHEGRKVLTARSFCYPYFSPTAAPIKLWQHVAQKQRGLPCWQREQASPTGGPHKPGEQHRAAILQPPDPEFLQRPVRLAGGSTAKKWREDGVTARERGDTAQCAGRPRTQGTGTSLRSPQKQRVVFSLVTCLHILQMAFHPHPSGGQGMARGSRAGGSRSFAGPALLQLVASPAPMGQKQISPVPAPTRSTTQEQGHLTRVGPPRSEEPKDSLKHGARFTFPLAALIFPGSKQWLSMNGESPARTAAPLSATQSFPFTNRL